MVPNIIVMASLRNLVAYIRSHRSSPSEIPKYYQQEEQGFFEMQPAFSIPTLIFVLEETQIWTFICLSSLILGSLCPRWGVNNQTRQAVIKALSIAYEPSRAVDDGMTGAAKTLALANLGVESAVEHIRMSARRSGYTDIQDYGQDLFVKIIMTIASHPDEES